MTVEWKRCTPEEWEEQGGRAVIFEYDPDVGEHIATIPDDDVVLRAGTVNGILEKVLIYFAETGSGMTAENIQAMMRELPEDGDLDIH